MTNNMNFLIIGGDMRQIYLANSIKNDGHNVNLYGFENSTELKNLDTNLKDLIKDSKYIILPMPLTKDNLSINTPMSNEKIYIDDILPLIKDKYIFSSKFPNTQNFNKIKIYDYSSKEDFAILNAIPTAEAALQIAMSKRVTTLYRSKCLVAGFGKIGKVLSRLLYSFGTDLTVSARKKSDIAYIKSLNYKAIKTDEIKNSGKYEIIFNTIPYKIFDEKTLLGCTLPDTLIIDLASSPGGTDFNAAKALNINTIHALGLPGKFFPKSAAKLIKQTIYNIIMGENLYE